MTLLTFSVIGARPDPAAAAPALLFRLRVARPEGGERIHAVALRATLQIDTRRRRYGAGEQQRLYEVFGDPTMWDRSLKPLTWSHASVLVPAFDDEVEIDVPVSCTYDFDVAAAKYLHAVRDGDIPLQWLFSGTVFFAGTQGFVVTPIAWDSQASSSIPASLWRQTMDQYFSDGAWIRVTRATFDALYELRSKRAEAGWDGTLGALIDEAFPAAPAAEAPEHLKNLQDPKDPEYPEDLEAPEAPEVLSDQFKSIERLADAVMNEGNVLYPYRASAAKNRIRWQFGVVTPPAYAQHDPSERSALQTDCLLEHGEAARLDVRVRFLRVQSRQVESSTGTDSLTFAPVESLQVDERMLVSWDEGIPWSSDFGVSLDAILRAAPDGLSFAFEVAPQHEEELVTDSGGEICARVIHDAARLTGTLRLSAVVSSGLITLRARLENLSEWPDDQAIDRTHALRRSFVAAHLLMAAHGTSFVSTIDPPPDAAPLVSACRQEGLWPSLAGDAGRRDLLLCAPIILADHPAIALESPGDLCDGAEIDEILTLRIMTMTDEEKREARATDRLAREIVERSDSLPAEALARLHGTIRHPDDPPSFETLLNPPDEASPETAHVVIKGAPVARGSHVTLRPARRADPMDMFLAGRAATVTGVYRDVENRTYVAVTIDDDPAADLHGTMGRYYYFYPDELEVREDTQGADSAVAQTEVQS